MKTNKGKISILLGLLLIAAALFLTAYNLCDELRAANAAKRVLLELPPEIRDTLPTEGQPEETEETEPELEFPDYVLNPNMEMPVENINGIDFIGVLRIPALELELPVISQWSYPNLKSAPCRYAGSAYLNNLIICAHNYTSHFGNLKNLQEGDIVTFQDMDGNVFDYEVALLETLMPTDIEEMESSGWDLTLFTCTIGGSYRVTVRCDLVTENGGGRG